MKEVIEKASGILNAAKSFIENEGHEFSFSLKSIDFTGKVNGSIIHELFLNGKKFDFKMTFSFTEMPLIGGSIHFYGMNHKKTISVKIEYDVTFAEIENVFDNEQLLNFCKLIVSEYKKFIQNNS